MSSKTKKDPSLVSRNGAITSNLMLVAKVYFMKMYQNERTFSDEILLGIISEERMSKVRTEREREK